MDRRRERVRRHLARRPPTVDVEVTHAPADAVRAELVAVLAEMLDSRRQSGRP